MPSNKKRDRVVNDQQATTLLSHFTQPLDNTDWQEGIEGFLAQKSAHTRPKTVLFYSSRLQTLSLWAIERKVTLANFTSRDMDRYIASRRDLVTETTLHHDGLAAKQLLAYAYQNGLCEKDVLRGYKIVPVSHAERYVPSLDEVKKLIQVVKDTWDPSKGGYAKGVTAASRRFYERRNLAIVIGVIATACRISELFSLKLEDIRFDTREIIIHHSKTHESRTVPVSQEWLDMVRDYLKVRPRIDSTVVFIDHFGAPMTYEAFAHTWKRYRDRAGLKQVQIHSLRHRSLSELYRKSGDLKATMMMAGHRSAQTAMRYQHRNSQQLRAAYDQADLLDGVVEKVDDKKKRKIV